MQILWLVGQSKHSKQQDLILIMHLVVLFYTESVEDMKKDPIDFNDTTSKFLRCFLAQAVKSNAKI